MRLVSFHEHLLEFDCEMLYWTGEDYDHAVYKNKNQPNRKYTLFKNCINVMPETIILCCYALGIPVPGTDAPMIQAQAAAAWESALTDAGSEISSEFHDGEN